ncbi:hypothetical protein D3C73_882650 [compost metagenome]
MFNGWKWLSSLMLVEGIFVELTHCLLKTLAVGIHEAVVNQITVIIEIERIAEVVPFFFGVNANHPAVLQIPFHLIIESVVFAKTLAFVGLCRKSVVYPLSRFGTL